MEEGAKVSNLCDNLEPIWREMVWRLLRTGARHHTSIVDQHLDTMNGKVNIFTWRNLYICSSLHLQRFWPRNDRLGKLLD